MAKYDFNTLKKDKAKGLLKKQDEIQNGDSSKKHKKVKKIGRPADPKGTKVSLSLSTIPRHEDGPFIIVNGSGRRNDTKFVNLPIPIEVYNRVKEAGNISPSLVALLQYGLECLDKKNETLWAVYKKEIDNI